MKSRFPLFSNGAHKLPRGQIMVLHSPNLNLQRKQQNTPSYEPSAGIYRDTYTCIGLLKLFISYYHPLPPPPSTQAWLTKLNSVKEPTPGDGEREKIETIRCATPNQRLECGKPQATK